MDLIQSRRGRAFLLALLYFAEGAPIGWLWWALPTRLRAAGAPLDEVNGIATGLGGDVGPESYAGAWLVLAGVALLGLIAPPRTRPPSEPLPR